MHRTKWFDPAGILRQATGNCKLVWTFCRQRSTPATQRCPAWQTLPGNAASARPCRLRARCLPLSSRGR